MSSLLLPLYLIVLLLLLPRLRCGRLSAFNLDTDNVLKKSGDPGSLFGFSLAMHRQLNPVDKRMLLVGAPRAKALSGQKAKVTGGLYSCDMSSTSAGCSRVDFDNDEDLTRESKENQWMGVTVNSQGPGGKIVTCAHRYQRRTNVNTAIESRDIIGRCYVLSEDLTINPISTEDGGSWHFCDSRPRGHEMFGSCQQGLSATFDDDYHYLIFGAPGAYNWKGVVRLEQKNETFVDLGIFDDGPFEVGDEDEKNPELVPAPANSYLGFSLDSGRTLITKGVLTVVAGAPRANHSGAVVLLKKGKDTSNILLEEYTLEGEGLASSFGYDLAVLDLNWDGWEDIVVGAPQYFEKDGEIGGAVYIYINKAGKWDQVTPTRIDGPRDSMFGLAVEKLGDINQDSFHDFAVGAPYEDHGAGHVYIYHGSASGQVSKKAAQVLAGKPLGAKLFGYSLAGNMDLDKNSYPDLAVGSLSDAVFVYRARPVINIKKEIKFSPSEIDLTKKNCGNSFWYACFTYTANPKSYTPRLSKLNKLRGIPIDVSVNIQDAKRKRRQQAAPLTPVLDANEPMITRSEVNFLKEGCGRDSVCQSNLEVKYRYGHRSTDADSFTPLKLENGVPVISLSDQKNIALEVSVTNKNGDDAHEAYVIVSLPRSLTYSAYRRPVTCIANKDGSKADCELGNPFKTDAETTFYVILGTAGISSNTSELEIDLQLKTQAQPSQVYFTGEVKGEAAMKTESDIGSAIIHQFRVVNLGKRLKDLGTASLDIYWPKETEQGKWLLYLMKISSTGVDKMECTPKGEINPLNKVSEGITLVCDIYFPCKPSFSESSSLSCGNGANCVRIRCPLRGMDSSAVITLQSRLWNSTFIELFLPLYCVVQVRLTVFPERRAAQYGGVPWWIIVLSILLGLLLLALLAFVLWKVGLKDADPRHIKLKTYSTFSGF
uniref:Integrin alpha-2 domain-containing protein n=1 Tax=Amphiprion ocellaris TaxID=80972 RepID=A0AAQ5YWM3_AMPOC